MMQVMAKGVVFLLILGWAVQVRAQETARYSFFFTGQPVAGVLAEIERQTGYTFSYESALLTGSAAVTLHLEQVTLPECLQALFSSGVIRGNTPGAIHWQIRGRHIILTRASGRATISGTVQDAVTGETLVGATLYDAYTLQGTTTNEHGSFSLTLPCDTLLLTVSFVGYQPQTHRFLLRCDTLLRIRLQGSLLLEEVAVWGEAQPGWLKNTQPGQTEFPVQLIKTLPSLLSEGDVMRTLQLMPGVKSGNETMAGLFVRGGNVDENLYLMDGIPVYNPSHMAGFFSTFNANAIKKVDFYKGSFPARYGGRLSSVVDVRLKEGNRERLQGAVSIGLVASKIDLEGPLGSPRTTFVFSGRRTYLDLFTNPLIRSLTTEKGASSLAYNKGGYHFTDLNLKLTRLLSDRDQLSLNLYLGEDRVRYSDHLRRQETFGNDQESYTNRYTARQTWKWGWGNTIASVEYGRRLTLRLYGQWSVALNRYRSEITSGRQESTYSIGGKEEQLRLSTGTSNRYVSGITDVMGKALFDYAPHPAHRIRFGGEYVHHTFFPETSRYTYHLQEAEADGQQNSFGMEHRIQADEVSLFAEDEIRAGDRLRFDPGVRFTLFWVDGTRYLSLEPRLAVQFEVNRTLSVKASWSEMGQYIHLLSFGGVSLPSDLWVPVTRKIRPMRSRQLSGGAYLRPGAFWSISVEGYYKTLRNQIDYLDGATILPAYRNWEENVAVGRGEAYGIELQGRKERGRTTGWINYTLSWAYRWFPGGEINRGRHFPAKNDSRHGINVVVIHRFNDRFDISAAWVFNTGGRATVSLERYNGAEVEGAGYFYPEIDHIEYRNNYRMPDYHRLDLGANFHRRRKRGLSTWNVSIYNVYSRLNPFFVYMEEPDIQGSGARPRLRQASIFPVIPSFSYTYSF